MQEPLTLEAIASDPQLAAVKVSWRSEAILFRPLRPDDGRRLFAYFETLSDETRYLYHPHPFAVEQAERLCAEARQGETIRMVAVRHHDGVVAIVAYIILDFGLSEDDVARYRGYGVELSRPICRIGPSVSDSLRGQGLGTVLMRAVRDIARRFGCAHIILLGGVFTVNDRAIRYYEKVGMRRMGVCGGGDGPPSWDMMAEL